MIIYNEKFAKPGKKIMTALRGQQADHAQTSSTKRSSGRGSTSGTTKAAAPGTARR